VLFDETQDWGLRRRCQRHVRIIKDIRARGVTVVLVEQTRFRGAWWNSKTASYVLEQGARGVFRTRCGAARQPHAQERLPG